MLKSGSIFVLLIAVLVSSSFTLRNRVSVIPTPYAFKKGGGLAKVIPTPYAFKKGGGLAKEET